MFLASSIWYFSIFFSLEYIRNLELKKNLKNVSEEKKIKQMVNIEKEKMHYLKLTETIAIRNPVLFIVFLLTYRELLLSVLKPTSLDQFPKFAISVRFPFDHHSFNKLCRQHATNISVLNLI